jgi:hypothetical protein
VLVPLLSVTLVAGVKPVSAGGPAACQVAKAAVFAAAGDRYRARADYATAARWYRAAARSTRDCRSTRAALSSAQSLAQAGAALVLGGDQLGGLELLRAAKDDLAAIAARDRSAGPMVEPVLARVQRVISAVDDVARSSM